MSAWRPIDTLELAWARERLADRHLLADVISITGCSREEWQEALVANVPAPESAERRTERAGIVARAWLEGWTVKEMARRAMAPRGHVLEVARAYALTIGVAA